MRWVTLPPTRYFTCSRCKKIRHRSDDSGAVEAASGEPICAECYRPLVLRLSQHEADLLHCLLTNAKWLADHVDRENLFVCTCEPDREYDTNAEIHDDDCMLHAACHLDATNHQAAELLSRIPKTWVSLLEGK